MTDVIIDFNNPNKEIIQQFLNRLSKREFAFEFQEISLDVYSFQFSNVRKDLQILNRIWQHASYYGNPLDVTLPVKINQTRENLELFKTLNPTILEFAKTIKQYEFLIEEGYNSSQTSRKLDDHFLFYHHFLYNPTSQLTRILLFVDTMRQFYLGENAKQDKISMNTLRKLSNIIRTPTLIEELLLSDAINDQTFKYDCICKWCRGHCDVFALRRRIFLTTNFNTFKENKEFRLLEMIQKRYES